jgi:hypothetical protein
MEQDLLSSVSQAGVVNGVAINHKVMSGVMWGFVGWFVDIVGRSISRYSMSAT